MEEEILKVNKKWYDKEDILFIFEQLDKGLHHKEISNLQNKFSTRQIKLIRFIYKNGKSKDINYLLSGDYVISRIKKNIQERKKLEKKRKKYVKSK